MGISCKLAYLYLVSVFFVWESVCVYDKDREILYIWR